MRFYGALLRLYPRSFRAVSARSREIGVRIAVGAKSRDILQMVMGKSAVMAMTAKLGSGREN